MSIGPIVTSIWSKTGEMRIRRTWYGKLVLQFRETRWVGLATTKYEDRKKDNDARWRDAEKREYEIASIWIEGKVRVVRRALGRKVP